MKVLLAILMMCASAVPQAFHYVDLQWQVSTTWQVDGYNVYRSTTSGGPYSQVNVSMLHRNTFTDSIVSSGVTYYYVARAAVWSQESGDSNEVKATIP